MLPDTEILHLTVVILLQTTATLILLQREETSLRRLFTGGRMMMMMVSREGRVGSAGLGHVNVGAGGFRLRVVTRP